MAVDFYDVKLKKKVSVDDRHITKVKFESDGGRTTYGIRGKTSDGRVLTKFVSQKDWESMRVLEEKAVKKAKAAPKAKAKAKPAPKAKAKK